MKTQPWAVSQMMSHEKERTFSWDIIWLPQRALSEKGEKLLCSLGWRTFSWASFHLGYLGAAAACAFGVGKKLLRSLGWRTLDGPVSIWGTLELPQRAYSGKGEEKSLRDLSWRTLGGPVSIWGTIEAAAAWAFGVGEKLLRSLGWRTI